MIMAGFNHHHCQAQILGRTMVTFTQQMVMITDVCPPSSTKEQSFSLTAFRHPWDFLILPNATVDEVHSPEQYP